MTKVSKAVFDEDGSIWNLKREIILWPTCLDRISNVRISILSLAVAENIAFLTSKKSLFDLHKR